MDRSLIILVLLLFTACAAPETEQGTIPDRTAEEERTVMVKSVDLLAHDMPLVVQLDPQVQDTATVRWNEQLGRLEVSAGEGFQLTIMEEEADLDRLKADLERDMLRKNTIIEETPDQVIYRSEFPDETITFVHFYRIVRHDGRTFVVQSNDQGRFNETDVKRMAQSVIPAAKA